MAGRGGVRQRRRSTGRRRRRDRWPLEHPDLPGYPNPRPGNVLEQMLLAVCVLIELAMDGIGRLIDRWRKR